MTMTFHCGNQDGHQCLEPFATETVCRLPQNDERLTDCFIVQATSSTCLAFTSRHFRQCSDRVFAVKAGQGRELVENARAFCFGSNSLPRANRCDQFLARSHADLPRRESPPRTIQRVANYMRQQHPFGNNKDESMSSQ